MKQIILTDKLQNESKLLRFGFEKVDEKYCYSTKFLNNQFEIFVEVVKNTINTKTIDLQLDEEYILHNTDATGEFVGKVRNEYQKIVDKIIESCFDNHIYKNNQTYQMIEYVEKNLIANLNFCGKNFLNMQYAEEKITKNGLFCLAKYQNKNWD